MAMAIFTSFWILLVAANLSGGRAQTVQMDSTKSGFVGAQVELRCLFVNSNPPVKISQVTWQKFVNGTKQNVAIANPTMGVSVLAPFKERVAFKQPAVRHRTPSLEDTTITFSNLRLSDEAAYICEYTTFPAGNRENMVNLTVFAQPVTRLTLTAPIIVARPQKHRMTVATCVSANGKPPSVITWETRLKGEATFQETHNANGTVTVHSSYTVVPTRDAHKQKLTCTVTYRKEKITESVVLNVQYEPEVFIEGFDGNWYLNRQNVQLTCMADANPPVTVYQWRLLNGSLPNVEIRNNSLFFKGPVTYDLAGTYVCDATNSVGTRSGQVEVNVTEKPLPRGAPGGLLSILGGLVALGLILGVAVTVYTIYQRQHRMQSKADNDGTDIPATHKCAPPPPLKRSGDSRTLLTSDDIQVLRLDKEAHHKLPPQTPYYDMGPTQSSHGKHHEDVSNPIVPLRRPHVHHTDFCSPSRPAAACLPLSYLPQKLCTPHPCDRVAPRNPPGGPQFPYSFPKEQTV
ncbi:nectin 1b isoform X1 [Paramormyrops kingsleyae]|uniref:nectin 1b isoform X1 n=1 Tax=Paramormyrops kingsleyae TaxID=1676925 RepID=UPI003B97B567